MSEADPVAWQHRRRYLIKGQWSAWQRWEDGRAPLFDPEFLDIEERPLFAECPFGAVKAERKAIVGMLALRPQDIRLKCGEMTAQEMRTVQAMLGWARRAILARTLPELDAEMGREMSTDHEEVLRLRRIAASDTARIASLEQAIRWCRPRLSKDVYRQQLDKKISLGPASPNSDPPIVHSDALTPTPASPQSHQPATAQQTHD